MRIIGLALLLGFGTLNAQTRLSFVKVSERLVEVKLTNQEPVAALQFTVTGSSTISLRSVEKAVRTSGSEWMLATNRVNDSTINVVLIRTTLQNLPAGSGSIVAASIVMTGSTGHITLSQVVLAGPDAQNITATIEPFDIREEASFNLAQNFPNPFNPSTSIPYVLKDRAQVKLVIYDIRGREIKKMVDAHQEPGTYSITWNSTDESGSVVPSGVYFVRLQVGNTVEARKMIFAK